MNKPVKYVIALAAGAAAVAVVAVVALPIVARTAGVDLSATAQQVVPTVMGSPDQGSAAAGTTTTWRLDSESTVGYRMADDGDVLLSGRTSEISGVITRSGDSITDAEFMVDLATLSGGSTQSALIQALVAATGGNTMASFVLTDPVTLPESSIEAESSSGAEPADADDSEHHTVPITGVLTVRGISNEVTAAAELHFDETSGRIVATIPVDLDAYGLTLDGFGLPGFSGDTSIDVDLVAVK